MKAMLADLIKIAGVSLVLMCRRTPRCVCQLSFWYGFFGGIGSAVFLVALELRSWPTLAPAAFALGLSWLAWAWIPEK